MSYLKGFTYANINNFCNEYQCKLITCEHELNDKTKMLDVISKCGHNSQVTFSKLVKHKFGVYCSNCVNTMVDQRNAVCSKCNVVFCPTKCSFLFCSRECGNSRQMTPEKKQKIKMSVLAYIENNPTNTNKRKHESDVVQHTEQNKKIKPKTSFDTIVNTYEKQNCSVVTTEEEYLKMRKEKPLHKTIIKIISACGHPSDSLYCTFVESGTCVICKVCTHKRTIEQMTNNAKTSDGVAQSLATNKIAIDIMKELCSDTFDVTKTQDGCESNILIRPIDPINLKNDSWLKVKLRSTAFSGNQIKFRIGKLYDNLITVLICTVTREMWIFLPHELRVRTYYMGKKRGVYTNNYIHTDQLNQKLLELFNTNLYNSTFDVANTPISDAMQLEYSYILKREAVIDFLTFTRNDMTGSVYNFKIGDIKVQESTFSRQPFKNSLIANLSKNAGHGTRQPYCAGDNDFYWLNINDHDEIFYVIPEAVLIENDYIQNESHGGNKYLNVFVESGWLEKYKFNYKTICNEIEKNRLCMLLNKNNK